LNIITCFQYLASIGSRLLQHLASIWKQVPVSSCTSNHFEHSQPHSACTHVYLFALLLITGRAALNLNIQKLNERYASSTLSTRMSLMWQLYRLSYQRGKDMRDFVDSFASILDRLECMGAKIDEDLKVIVGVKDCYYEVCRVQC
jgi:hypothetical protein